MSSFKALGALEILRDLATQVQQNNLQTSRFAYAGDDAWKKIVAEVSEYAGLQFSPSKGPLEYLGIRVALDSSLPPGTLLVGIEHNIQTAMEYQE